MPDAVVRVRVNGVERAVSTWPMQRLLDLLREQLKLTGVKEGCGEGECGACAVLVNGVLVNSCLIPACQIDGSSITTVEGLAEGGDLHPVQQAFLDCGGTQCGFCTSGMMMAVVSLLRDNPNPSPDDIRRSIAGNLCRCTGYIRIVESVIRAAEAAQWVVHESLR